MTGPEHLDAVAAELAAIEGVTVERGVPAAGFCTYRVGGPLSVLVRVDDIAALAGVASVVSGHDVDTLPLGRGSNLLVADAGFDGIALLLGDGCAFVDIDGPIVRAGAAALLPVVARATVAAGLTGFEWAVGVPGSIGGAVRMNAGGHGSDMSQSLVSVEVADLRLGGLVVRPAESLDLAYRHSNLRPWEVVASATVQLERGDPEAGAALVSEVVAWRRRNQPGGANAGSVFTNPEDDSAGRLIDAAGAKGLRVGSAEVSTKHANFIQVDPDGSADDVLDLMARLVELVEAEHGVRLEAETRLVGFPPDDVARVQHPTTGAGET